MNIIRVHSGIFTTYWIISELLKGWERKGDDMTSFLKLRLKNPPELIV
jgi:hypothetical protein